MEKVKVSENEFFYILEGNTNRYNGITENTFRKIRSKESFMAKIKRKTNLFLLDVKEIWCFIKHEFLTIRNLIFFINDLFFGKERKNRKHLYSFKKRLIVHKGYVKGEERFNDIVRNITKGAELNKSMIQRDINCHVKLD